MIDKDELSKLMDEVKGESDPEKVITLIHKAKVVVGFDLIPIFEYINKNKRPSESLEDAYSRLFKTSKT